MHVLVGYYASVANGTVYGAVPGATDQAMTLSANSKYILPAKWRLLAAFFSGVNLTAAQINAPSLRNLMLPEVYPTNVSATIPSRPPILNYGDYGPFIQQNEELGVNVSAGGGAPADVFGALWVADKMTPATRGPVFTAVGTATITAVKGQWSNGPITLATTLVAGQYEVVGMEVVAANTCLARLILPGSSQWRPGVVANSAYGNFILPSYFRNGAFGSYGRFWNTAQPQLEIFGLTAGAAAPTVYLDLVKVG